MNNLHKIIIDATKDIPIAFLKKMLREKITNAGKIPDEEMRSEEHTSELQSQSNLVCRLLLEKKKNKYELKLQSKQACPLRLKKKKFPKCIYLVNFISVNVFDAAEREQCVTRQVAERK